MSEDYQLAVMLKEGPRRQEVLRLIAGSPLPVSSKAVSYTHLTLPTKA